MKVEKQIIITTKGISSTLQYSVVALCALRIAKLALLCSSPTGTGITIASIGLATLCSLKLMSLAADVFSNIIDADDKRLSHKKFVLIKRSELKDDDAIMVSK